MSKSIASRALYESNFWLGILTDHTVFMFNSFSPKEKEDIQRTMAFNRSFEDLHNQVKALIDSSSIKETDIEAIIMRSYNLTCDFLLYQQHILYKRLKYEVALEMTPTFLEHMIREGKEFLRQLRYLGDCMKLTLPHELLPVRLSMHQHKLWLPDAAGHAAFIQEGLDMTEKELLEIARAFQKDFEGLFFKAYELKGMLDPEYPDIPAVVYMNEQAVEKTTCFVQYLARIKNLVEEKKVLSVIEPLVPDHMMREEAYYLSKLKEAYPQLNME